MPSKTYQYICLLNWRPVYSQELSEYTTKPCQRGKKRKKFYVDIPSQAGQNLPIALIAYGHTQTDQLFLFFFLFSTYLVCRTSLPILTHPMLIVFFEASRTCSPVQEHIKAFGSADGTPQRGHVIFGVLITVRTAQRRMKEDYQGDYT